MIGSKNEPRFAVGAMVSVLLAVSTVSASYGIVLPILPLMLQAIDGPSATTEVSRHTGLLTGVHALALFLFAPLWGKLSDRFGRRKILCLDLIGFGSSLLLSSIKLSIGMLYAERFLTGLFAAGITPVASALIADQGGSDEWRARRLAWLSMAAISGFLLGPMLSGLLATLSGTSEVGEVARSYELPFFTIAVVAAIASVAVRSFVPNDVTAVSAQGLTGHLKPQVDDVLSLLTLRTISFLVAAGVGIFEVGLALRGNQELGMPPAQVAIMFTVCSLVMFVVQAIVFSPKISPSWTRWLIAPALAVMATALLFIPVTSQYIALLTTVSVVAASAGILSPILTYWTSLESGKTKGAELGKQIAVVSLGQALGSVAGGSLYSFTMIPGAPFIVTALLLAAAAMTALKLPRWLEQRQALRSEVTIAEGPCTTARSPSTKI